MLSHTTQVSVFSGVKLNIGHVSHAEENTDFELSKHSKVVCTQYFL